MTQGEQQNAFEKDLDTLILRYRKEFDMSYASIVGVLQIAVVNLSVEIIGHPAKEDE